MDMCSASSIKTPSNSPFKGGECRYSELPSFEGGDGGDPRGQLLLAFALVFFGCALLTAGICIPPAGVIDSSVLVAFGEILTFAGSLIGIDYHYRYRLPRPPQRGGTTE